VTEARVQAAVVGGGVVGAAILRALAERGVEAMLLEAEPSLGEWASKANSAIVHTGFDAHPGSIEAEMLRRARDLWPALVAELQLPFLELGALMLGRDETEMGRLADEVAANAATLGVPTELVDRAALRELAPYVDESYAGALLIPGESVVDPFWLTRRLAEAASDAGARIRTAARVTALDRAGDRLVVTLADGTRLEAQQVIDAAGLGSADVARLLGDTSFSVTPRKGQFLVSEETFDVDRIVLPLPGPMGKGMLVTPIVFGGLLLGPTAEDQDDPRDRSTDPTGRERILAATRAMVPDVSRMRPIRQFAGLRPVSSTGDYVLRPSAVDDRLFLACGIRSTGVSASPAIGEHVAEEVCRLRGWAPQRRRLQVPELDFGVTPGRVVCPCRGVSAGEVLAACRSGLGASTLDAVKRASGAMFGDCQGNRCIPTVASLLDPDHEAPVLKGGAGSWALLPLPGDGDGHRPATRPGVPRTAATVVVGGGLAGIGAALAAVQGGDLPVVLVERASRLGGAYRAMRDALEPAEREAIARAEALADAGRLVLLVETDVVGLLEDGEGWMVELQAERDASRIAASRVVLACGGYLEPREHRGVTGGRPAGVWTADLAQAALDAGWLPGRRGLVLGEGRFAAATARRLEAAGCSAVLVRGELQQLRGDERLEAVQVGEAWHEVDSLFLADRLIPAPLLLRPLGLVDNRPGILPEVADDGTVLPGLVLAGSVLTAELDHRSSLDAGRRAGARERVS
jgi:glycerol-3-phosphate dehydrogenase